MGRVLKPSVKAISVSQTCCFPTEPTCQSGDLQPHGKHTHTHKHTATQQHPHTHKHQRGDILLGAAKHTIHVYLYRSMPGCKCTDKTNIGTQHTSRNKSSYSSDAHVHEQTLGWRGDLRPFGKTSVSQ